MSTDRVTKALLAIIAIGIWLSVVRRPVQPEATPYETAMGVEAREISNHLQTIDLRVEEIEHSLNAIAGGVCLNDKICG